MHPLSSLMRNQKCSRTCGFGGQPQLPRNRTDGDTFRPHRKRQSIEDSQDPAFLPSARDAYDAAVEEAIAACNGDLRGALKALIMANEFLERDLEGALASEVTPSITFDGNAGLRAVMSERLRQSAWWLPAATPVFAWLD
jgi:hypothetical protein